MNRIAKYVGEDAPLHDPQNDHAPTDAAPSDHAQPIAAGSRLPFQAGDYASELIEDPRDGSRSRRLARVVFAVFGVEHEYIRTDSGNVYTPNGTRLIKDGHGNWVIGGPYRSLTSLTYAGVTDDSQPKGSSA